MIIGCKGDNGTEIIPQKLGFYWTGLSESFVFIFGYELAMVSVI